MQDIAHVINYDLPEVAESFIHRVGRTGRAGGHGSASTLYVKEQRTELFQLERTLGIKIERMRPDGTNHVQEQHLSTAKKGGGYVSAKHSAAKNAKRAQRMVLPGEVFQAQLEG